VQGGKLACSTHLEFLPLFSHCLHDIVRDRIHLADLALRFPQYIVLGGVRVDEAITALFIKYELIRYGVVIDAGQPHCVPRRTGNQVVAGARRPLTERADGASRTSRTLLSQSRILLKWRKHVCFGQID